MSRKNFGAKPLSAPQPVWILATYDENGTPNAMNAAWGGISEETELAVCLSPGHKTCKNFCPTPPSPPGAVLHAIAVTRRRP